MIKLIFKSDQAGQRGQSTDDRKAGNFEGREYEVKLENNATSKLFMICRDCRQQRASGVGLAWMVSSVNPTPCEWIDFDEKLTLSKAA